MCKLPKMCKSAREFGFDQIFWRNLFKGCILNLIIFQDFDFEKSNNATFKKVVPKSNSKLD